MQTVVGSVRRRVIRDGANTPDASTRASRRTSGTSSIDSKGEKPVKEKKTKEKSTICSELARGICHLLFVVLATLTIICVFEYHMLHYIEWEHPKVEQPKLMAYYGASFMTKDFDCSILARRCYMMKKRLRTCFVPALLCNAMLRPDMFSTHKHGARKNVYYVNARHVTSGVDLLGKKKEIFNTFHEPLMRSHILSRLQAWNETFVAPLTNSKGMPRDNQLFFIPWELRDEEDQYKHDFTYVDLNMDDVPDCIQPRVNTDVGRRDWIATFNAHKRDVRLPPHNRHLNNWTRETTQRTEKFRVDTVPGFSGALVKKILDVAVGLVDQELAHKTRELHVFTDDHLLLIYRHVLLHAIRNPFQLLFMEKDWKKSMEPYDPKDPLHYKDWSQMPTLSNPGSSISFLFGASVEKTTKIPDTLAVTISEAKSKFGHAGKKDFDLNVPIRISSGLSTIEIVSSSSGERAFHANIITALRVMLRLRLYKGATTPDFNDVLHIPMAFYSLEEKKMVFDRYAIKTDLRELLCKKIDHCATPFDQNSLDWQRRFNGTTAIQFHGSKRAINSRVDTTQDKANYAVGF